MAAPVRHAFSPTLSPAGRGRHVAWVFNLDAEDELTHPGAHTPTATMMTRIERLLPRLSALLSPGDQVLFPASGEALKPGLVGRAWSPTRWALTQMERAGVELPQVPTMEVLRTVNHRRFNHHLGQTLPGAGYAVNEAELNALLTPSHDTWLLKRPFGYAGRGRRKLRVADRLPADQSWVDASLRSGEGLQVEPWVERVFDCALHGWLDETGEVTLGEPTLQEVDDTGAWQSSRLAHDDELTASELERLRNEAQRVAGALSGAGYFGPFGIDAFRYGANDFQPRSEINARYSMGWAVGMGR